jgi:hypothetical protein
LHGFYWKWKVLFRRISVMKLKNLRVFVIAAALTASTFIRYSLKLNPFPSSRNSVNTARLAADIALTVFNMRGQAMNFTNLIHGPSIVLAEDEGFEPSGPLRILLLSRELHYRSANLP